MHQFSFTIMTTSASPDSNDSPPSPTMETLGDANGSAVTADDVTDFSPVKDEREDKTHKEIIKEFVRSTSCHCLPRIIGARSTKSRLFWSVVFCAAVLLFIVQASKLIVLYASFELAVRIEDETVQNISFPAVTICNTNKLRLSKIEESEFSDLAKTDPDHPDTIHRMLSYPALKSTDESPDSCLPGDYMCADGERCIKPHLKCDGYFHCWDGLSDEINCTYPPCRSEEFNCGRAGEYGVCIHEDRRCDGVQHCFGGEDEEGCSRDSCTAGFLCDVDQNGRGTCLPNDKVCDRFPDCSDRTDEFGCNYNVSCGKELTATSYPASLYSPRYPEPYEKNESCKVHINAEEDSCIEISFLDMNMEQHSVCKNDFLMITDVHFEENFSVKLCSGRIPDRWVSLSNAVRVWYRTDSIHHNLGFHLQYKAVKCPSPGNWTTGNWSVCSEECGGGTQLREVKCKLSTGEEREVCPGMMPQRQRTCNTQFCFGPGDICGKTINHCCHRIRSEGYLEGGYANGIKCSYFIVNPNPKGCVNITIQTMSLADSKGCSKDFIKFEDLQTPSLTMKFCGQTTATQDPALLWNSYSEKVRITFNTDGEKLVGSDEDGYQIRYDFVPCGVWHQSPWSKCTVACGIGKKFRKVNCRSRATWTIEPDSYCTGPKPPDTEPCTGREACEARSAFVYEYKKNWCSDKLGVRVDVRLCEEFDRLYAQTNKFLHVPKTNPTWRDYLIYSSSPDYSDLRSVLKLNKAELSDFGHQLEDLVIQCSFNEETCDLSRDFIRVQSDVYGNCYTYNHGRQGAQRKYTDGELVGTGLKLTLFIEQDEYVPLYGQDAGVRVVIHPPEITPFPEDYGINIPPGRKGYIAIRKDSFVMEGSPFLDCTDRRKFQSIYGEDYDYSVAACHKSAVNKYIMNICGCVDTIWLEDKGNEQCLVTKETQERCRQLVRFVYRRGLLKNNCQQSCRRTQYSSTVSLSQWPSNKHMPGLFKILRPINPKVQETVVGAASARDNLLSLEIAYEEPNYRNTISSPRYSIDQLTADIGGLFGLYLGISLITVVEFIELVYDLYCYFISWKRVDEKKQKTKQRDHKRYDLAPTTAGPDEFGTRV